MERLADLGRLLAVLEIGEVGGADADAIGELGLRVSELASS